MIAPQSGWRVESDFENLCDLCAQVSSLLQFDVREAVICLEKVCIICAFNFQNFCTVSASAISNLCLEGGDIDFLNINSGW